MFILSKFSKDISLIDSFTRLIAIEHFFHVLFAAGVMLIGRPVGVELVAELSILLLLICLLDKRVL